MYGSSGPSSRTQRPKKERKVTAIFRDAANGQHSAALTSLALDGDGEHVYTASRDFTLRRWKSAADSTALTVVSTFNGHTDWVNDVAVLGRNVVATASADTTIRLWLPDGTPKYTFFEHKDHVTCLAAAPAVGLLASGGLSGKAFLWDIHRGTQLHQEYRPWEAPGLKHSVYSIALSADGSILATGSPEGCIRLTDPRADSKICKLRGHSANVRALVLNRAGTQCASASSDGTVRLWDMGQQRCVSSYAVHDSAVWALAVDPGFTTATSGGRDGCIYRTDFSSRATTLLCSGLGPVRRLAYSVDCGLLWAASEGAGLTAWPGFATSAVAEEGRAAGTAASATPSPKRLQRESPKGKGIPGSPDTPSPGRAVRARMNSPTSSPSSRGAPLLSSSPPGPALDRLQLAGRNRGPVPGRITATSSTTAGGTDAGGSPSALPSSRDGSGGADSPAELPAPGARTHFVAPLSPALRSRQSIDGVSAPVPLHTRPLCAAATPSPLKEAAVLLDQRHVVTRDRGGAVLVWDVTTGAVVQRRVAASSLAEAVAALFRPEAVPPWFTVSVESGLLAVMVDPAARGVLSAEVYAADLGFGDALPEDRLPYGEQFVKGLFFVWATRAGIARPESRPRGDPSRHPTAPRASFNFWQGCEPPPVVVCEGENGKPWRRLVTALDGKGLGGFDGTEGRDMVPLWVIECLAKGQLPRPGVDVKCAFQLLPAEGSGLRQLDQTRLNAPAVMRVGKVADYVHQKIPQLAPPVEVHLGKPVQPLPAGSPPTLELVCDDQALPFELTLAAIRKFIWQRDSDIEIRFRIMDPQHPAPMPDIRPP